MYIFRTITSKIRLLACAAGLAALGSCDQDVFQAPIVPVESHDGQISVLYEVEGDIPLTRGIAALEHEKSLDHVYILFFDRTQNESYAGCALAPASSGGSTVKFDPPETVLPNTQYRLLVVGNGKDHQGSAKSFEATLNTLTSEETYTDVRGKLMAYADESVVDPENLPLCGRFVKPDTDQELYFTYNRTEEGLEFPYAEGQSIFRFQRAICRVDLHNLVANVLDIRYVRLVNTRSSGYYFFDGLNSDTYHPLDFKEDHKSPGFVDVEAAVDGQQLQRLEAKLYCYPNTVNTCLPNDEKTTAAMIAGYYTDPETGEKDDYLTYYRFNISNAGEAQSLQRNYCYRASIKGVKRKGQKTELDAFKESSPIFVYDIGEEWNTDDDNVVTDEFGNFLVVSKSLLTFTGDQSGADVVKLTVNTSDGMDWKIEMDDESAKYFQARKIDGAPGEKIQAFTCGPKQTNYSEYYYEGSLWIVATNKNTGRELRKEVRLVQLTTSGDVKCLVVNDYTSSFAQEVSKYGQTISYKVITGNPTNKWEAIDVDNKKNSWGDNITFTESGTNGNYFTITFPANIKQERYLDIEFRFSCDDPEYNNEIKPITVRFHQEVCDQPLTIEGWPTDGVLTLNCFDQHTGLEYANCVAQEGVRKFTVHLQRPDLHYFDVESNFDKFRDLTLSDYDCRVKYAHEIQSVHPGLYYHDAHTIRKQELDEASQSQYNDRLLKRTKANSSFYINAFRMGPGDATISGKITITVKDIATDADVPNGKLELSVKLMVPNDQYMLNDVLIKNNCPSYGKQEDNGWIYIMDRNIGCEPRMHTDVNGNIYNNEALWGYVEEGEKTEEWKITNMTNMENWIGTLELLKGTSLTYKEEYFTEWKQLMKDNFKHLGKMYEKADDYPWTVFSKYTAASIKNNVGISKGRYFILSDISVCPLNSKGSPIRVASWLPYGCSTAYATVHETSFTNFITEFLGKSYITNDKFWCSSGDGTVWHGNNNVTLLVRLMYMIGYPGGDNLDYGIKSLSADRINEQLEYYKNHILKCYDAK